MTVIDWLLDADPSIRWQVMRDLTRRARRRRRRRAGAGRDRGLGRAAARAPGAGRPVGRRPWSHDWTDTFHVLELLRRLGLDPASEQARRAVGLVREHVTWRDPDFETPWADNRFFEGEVEPCINGNVVATGAYFGVDMTPLVERLLGEQLPDGGWNCEVENGATVSSFETTINVLEGLLEHERAIGGSAEVREARRRGEAYLLERRLFRRKSTGEVIDPSWLAVLVPDLVPLRRPARARLPARGRRRAGRPRRRGDRRSSRPTGTPTAGGRSRTSTRARPTSRWTSGEGRRVAGTRCRALRVLDWFTAGRVAGVIGGAAALSDDAPRRAAVRVAAPRQTRAGR